MKSSYLVLAAVGSLGLTMPVANAQESESYRPSVNTDLSESLFKAGLRVSDWIRIVPKATLKLGYDDNAGLTPDLPPGNPAPQNSQKRSGAVTDFSASIDILFGVPEQRFGSDDGSVVVSLKTDAFNYSSSSLDNTTTSSIGIVTKLAPTSRFDLKSSLKYTDGEDARGTINDNRQVNSYDLIETGIALGYGAAGAKGRLEFDLGFSDKEYDADATNPLLQAQDVQKASYTPRFLWRVAPKTRVFVEGNLTSNEYARDLFVGSPELDNTDTRLSVGAKWDATAKTSGSVNVGAKRRAYDVQNVAQRRTDTTEAFWDVVVSLNATEIDTFTAATGQDFADDFQNAGQQTTQYFSLAWRHEWKGDISTNVSYRFANDDYAGFFNPVSQTVVQRDDDTNTLSATASYQMRDWLSLGTELTYEDRSSNLEGNTLRDNFSYDRTLFLLTASAVF